MIIKKRPIGLFLCYNFDNRGGLMKRVLITGAASGMGKELTKLYISKGYEVIGLDINEKGLDELKATHKRAFDPYIVNLGSREEIISFKNDFHKEIDILINNAGIIQPFIKVVNLEEEKIKRIMDINFYGPLLLTKLFLPEFIKANRGHIVNVSSMGGFFPFPGQTIYGASKSAVSLLTEGLYAELLNTNVVVSLVIPGAIATNISENSGVKVESSGDSKVKPLEASKAAEIIYEGIEKKKMRIYVGTDSKVMKFLYTVNPKFAIKFISKQMAGLIQE
jgi:short-subunit dehydrogenase